MRKWFAVCGFAALIGCAPASAGTRFQQLPLASNELVLNPADGYFYAAVPDRSSTLADTVAVIDPASASVIRTIPALGEPTQLSLSDNGRYLYVLVPAAKAVERLDLLTGQPDETLTFGSDLSGTPYTPEALSAVPGSPQSVVVSLHGSAASRRLTVFDGIEPRPRKADVSFGAVRTIQFTDSPGWVLATAAGGAAHYALDAAGIYQADEIFLGSGFSDNQETRYRNGVVYFDSGRALTLASYGLDAWSYNLAPFASTVFPEPEADRVYFVHPPVYHEPLEIVAFYLKARVPAARWVFPDASTADVTPRSLQRWGSDGLAFRTSDDRIFFVRSSALVAPPLPQVDLVTPALPPVDLAVTLTANAGPPRLGENGLFSIKVTNRGTQPASDVTLHAATSPLGLGQPWVEYYAGGLAPGASKTFAWSITATHLPSLTATVRATSNEAEINPADNTATYASPVAPSRMWNLTTSWERLRRVHTPSGDRLEGILVVSNIGLAKSKASKVELEQSQDKEHSAPWVSIGTIKVPAISGQRSVRIAVDRLLPRPEFPWVRVRTKPTVIFSPDWNERYTQIPNL